MEKHLWLTTVLTLTTGLCGIDQLDLCSEAQDSEFNLSSGIFSRIHSILYDPPGYAFLNC